MVRRMTIKLVIFDADKTLWSHPDVSSLALPFKLVDRNLISDANGETFHLFDGIRHILSELQKRCIILTIASWNKPKPVKEAMQLFGIAHFFKLVKAEFHPNKHLMIADILSTLSKEGINLEPQEILYVDDRDLHLNKIKEKIGPLRFVQMWVDAKTPNKILDYIEKQENKEGC